MFVVSALAGCATSSSPQEGPDASVTDVESSGGDWFKPVPGATWQWQLSGTIDTSVDVAMFDVDLFDAPDEVLAQLRSAGRTIICYFSAGSREDWRADSGDFAASDHGAAMEGWPGETWLDVRSSNVREIMKKRLDRAVARGCDGVEPDNVDGYQNTTGFDLTAADQTDFNRFLAKEAHDRGLSVGLKNALGLVAQLEPDFDWALNEECVAHKECSELAPFLAANKAVFHVEYVNASSEGSGLATTVCADPTRGGFSTLIKTWDLDAWRLVCH